MLELRKKCKKKGEFSIGNIYIVLLQYMGYNIKHYIVCLSIVIKIHFLCILVKQICIINLSFSKGRKWSTNDINDDFCH